MVTARPRLLRLAFAAGLALTATGCETLDKFNPFVEKEKVLPGARQKVFPEGVPGVDYSAAPSQPSNSNAAIDRLPDAGAQQGQQGQKQN